MRIVDDDDVGWKDPDSKQEKALDEDDELPAVAEFVDERPKEIKLMEEFRSGNKWKVMQDDNEDSQGSNLSTAAKSTASSDTRSKERGTEGSRQSPDLLPSQKTRHDSPESSPSRVARDGSPTASPPRRRHDSPEPSSPRRVRHDSSSLSPPPRKGRHDSPDQSPPRKGRHNSPDQSPPRKGRHDSPDQSPPRKGRHDSPDQLPPRKGRHDSPDLSPPKKGRRTSPDITGLGKRNGKPTSGASRTKGRGSPSRQTRHSSSDLSPPRNKRHDSDDDLSPPRKKTTVAAGGKKPTDLRAVTASPKRRKHHTSSVSPPRRPTAARPSSDSDLSPPRNPRRPGVRPAGSDSDLSPPRRTSRKSPDSDLSPPRRAPVAKDWSPRQRGDTSRASQMLSGGKAGLVSAEVLKKEKKDTKKKERENKPLEEESKTAETVFRDKSGRKRDLQQEREEKQRTAGVKSQREEQYAQWGQGLVQRQMQQQNVLDAAKEIDKPLARYIDDQDLDQMLREQERDGDPMANFIKKKKVKEDTKKKARPKYSGPAPPPNRFDIWPGHRWDGVDRSNGFEQKRYARQADKKAVDELAYKWSVEDM